MITTYSEVVWTTLSAIPMEIFDEENYSVWDNSLWELVTPRFDGEYSGKRTIGTANIVTAYNLLHLKMITDGDSSESYQQFKTCLEELSRLGLIRRRPEVLRRAFKSV